MSSRPLGQVLRRISAGVEKHGVLKMIGLTASYAWGETRRHLRDFIFDARRGVDTRGLGRSQGEVYGYQATPARRFLSAVRSLPIMHEEFTFVDIGCGKGRTLLLTLDLGFKQVIGIELDAGLVSLARRNLDSAVPGNQCQVVIADAGSYVLPPGPLVLYLYNAFGPHTMHRFLDGLDQTMATDPRPIYLLYYNPTLRELLDRRSLLSLFALRRGYAIYKSLPSATAPTSEPA